MKTEHFRDKLAAAKERALLLESTSVAYLDMLRIKNLIRECDNQVHPTEARVSFLHEVTDVINTVELRLTKENHKKHRRSK